MLHQSINPDRNEVCGEISLDCAMARSFDLRRSTRQVVYYARRIRFLQLPRCDRCRRCAALLWLGRSRNYLILVLDSSQR
jgi:hypothetical protein